MDDITKKLNNIKINGTDLDDIQQFDKLDNNQWIL